jgi:hypothetical protein
MYSAHSIRRDVRLGALFQPGDHVCHFGSSADDLGEILVPYFKAGLERNECCVWITGHPFGKDRAVSELRAAVPDLDRRTAAGQMRIWVQEECRGTYRAMTTAEKVRAWLAEKDEAIRSGYAGLRAGGNTPSLSQKLWHEFLIDRRALGDAFKDQPIIALRSYCMDKCPADGVFDVVHCHGLGLAKCHGSWRLIEIRSHQPEALIGGPADTSARQGADFRLVVEDQLAFFIAAHPERIGLEGGHVHLSEAQATRLGIVINELATNAAQHGALSSPQGKLAVRWHVVSNGSRRLHIKWTESGMTGLAIPDRVGFGTQLIASAMGNCVRTFHPTGMVCKLELDLEPNH